MGPDSGETHLEGFRAGSGRCDIWQAAGYLGMTVETLSARYGHHHPDHLAGARNAFDQMHFVRDSVGKKEGKSPVSSGRSGRI
jgi:hypothetical protein